MLCYRQTLALLKIVLLETIRLLRLLEKVLLSLQDIKDITL